MQPNHIEISILDKVKLSMLSKKHNQARWVLNIEMEHVCKRGDG